MNKADYRKVYRDLVRGLSSDEKKAFSESLAEQLRPLLLSNQIKKIGVFMPLSDEADITGLYEELWQAGKELFLPKVISETEMNFYSFQNFDRLIKSEPYSILEPKGEVSEMIVPNDLDLIVISGLSFDKECYRLGRGKAYYDRYLAKCPKVQTIGIHLGLLEIENLSPNEWDIPVSQVLKPSSINKNIETNN